MKKGEKYIIEIAEVHTHFDDNGKAFPLARIKGFSSLVFDQRGLDKLEKVKVGEPLKKPLECRFVCLTDVAFKRKKVYTKGKIYEVKDGKFEDDLGCALPIFHILYTEDELVEYMGECLGETPVYIVILKD